MDNKNGITNGLKGKTISTVELLAMTNGKSSKIYRNSHILCLDDLSYYQV